MAKSNVVEFRVLARSSSVAPVGVSAKSLELIGRAEALLANARKADADEMLELSYRAAIRCAGALLNREEVSAGAGSRAVRRRSASQSVWVALRKEQPEYEAWVSIFEQVAPLREKVRLGLARRIAPDRAREIWGLSCKFLADVKSDLGVLPAAA